MGGIVYVPTGCEGSAINDCKVHVNYHGCINKVWERRKRWANNIDLNEYGEANNIVIYYPQAAGDRRSGVGCWSWSDYRNDPYFDTRKGVQLATVMAVVNDLANALKS